MTALLTRRKVLAGMGVLGLGLLAGCDTRGQLSYKYGKDLSNKIMGRTFKLKNTDGETMTLSSFRGMMPMVFFGFTQCPAVCPTTLARAAKIKKLMGADGDRLQVIFISLDPERDTPEILKAYVGNFGADFVALRGDEEQTKAAAKSFKVFFAKVPGKTPESYTIDHTAGAFVFDPSGQVRLFVRYGMPVDDLVSDIRQLL